MTAETWKDVVGYEGLYSVSDRGNVRSENRTVTRRDGTRIPVQGRILKPGTIGTVQVVSLCRNNSTKTMSIARLVMMHHRPNLSGFQVKHLDGDSSNNAVDNLYYKQRALPLSSSLPSYFPGLTDEEIIRMHSEVV